MLSYTKAVLDYKLATQHEEKILANKLKLSKIKVYYPSEAMLEWRESIDETPGERTKALEQLRAFVKELEAELGVNAVEVGYSTMSEALLSGPPQMLVTKTMNNRYKLAGDFCIRLYYGNPGSANRLHFPADPEIVSRWNVKEFLATYTEIFKAYSVSKDYVKKIRTRITVLRDEF